MEITNNDISIQAIDAGIAKAMAHVMAARAELQPLLIALDLEERKHLLPVPAELPTIAPEVVQAASAHPLLAQLCPEFDPALVLDRIRRVVALAPVANQLDDLARAVADTRLVLSEQAYRKILGVHRVAKTLSENDRSLLPVVRPLNELFASRR